MSRLIAVIGIVLAASSAAPLQAKQVSLAQTDAAEHLLVLMTPEQVMSETESGSYFGLPDTGVVDSVWQEPGGQVHMRFEVQGEPTRELPLPLAVDPTDKISAWPKFHAQTPERGHIFLLGVVIGRSEGYSGGGASVNWLYLFRVDNPASDHSRAREVLALPLEGDRLIRACFNERDEAARQGICHDSYAYEAKLRLDEEHRGEWPVLIYRSKAVAHPGLLVSAGSIPDRPLATEEFTQREDRECSFQRKLRFNPITRRYEMDAPAPDAGTISCPAPTRPSACAASSVLQS